MQLSVHKNALAAQKKLAPQPHGRPKHFEATKNASCRPEIVSAPKEICLGIQKRTFSNFKHLFGIPKQLFQNF